MSQQHPSFPPHLPRGAVAAASALTLSKNSVTTVLRASPAIQIPAAPIVPSVSMSMPGLPTALVRSPVISAIRPATPPNTTTTRAPSPAISMPDHPRTNLIVQGAAAAGTATPLTPGQPLQITLTQRLNPGVPPTAVGMVNPAGAATVGISEAMKLTPFSLSGKPVQVAQPGGMVTHQKLAVGVGGQAPPAGSMAGISMAPPHLQHPHQAVLAAASNKAGGLQVTGAMPAVSISSLSAAMPTTTVLAPASTAIPVAKVTPQRQQQLPLTSTLPASIAVQTTSGSEFTTVADLSSMATQTGASQLLLSQQTQRSQAASVITATTGAPNALSGTIPTAVTSLAAQHVERALAPTLFNLTAAAAAASGSGSGGHGQEPGQGQGNVWLQHFICQQAAARGPQLVSAPTPTPNNTPSPLIRPPPPPAAANTTFFVPRPSTAEQAKVTNQTASLASLSHPTQPTVLFSAHMMVEGGGALPHSLAHLSPLNPATFTAASSSVNTMVTGVGGHGNDGKPVLSLAPGSSGPGSLHASLVAASTAVSGGSGPSQPHAFPPSTSLHMAVNMAAAGNPGTGVSVLPPSLALSSASSLASRVTVASSLISVATAHHAQLASSSCAMQQSQGSGPSTAGGSNAASNSSASPRPSILRKRTVDGNSVMPRKPNFNLMAESHSPRPDTAPTSNISSPKTPATENSQSSTDTALSSNDATTPTHTTQGDVAVKTEATDTGGPSVASPAVSNASEASPRKRARKQLFDVSRRNVSEEVKQNSSSDEEPITKVFLSDIKQEHPMEHLEEYIDGDGVRWTRDRTKPAVSIMSDYSVNWKPKNNHFQRPSDVRPKEDRHPTVNELISQRGILQKASGWRLYYVSTQLEAVIENEESMEQRMEKLKERLASMSAGSCSHSFNYDYNKLLELFRGNLQRCQVVRQQMQEARASMLNLLKHEPKIREIITKNLAKRSIKKKERS